MNRYLVILGMVSLSLAFGCDGELHVGEFVPATETTTVVTDTTTEVVVEDDDERVTDREFTLSGNDAVFYMSQISHMLVSSPLSVEERAQLEAEGEDGIRPILQSWSEREGFALAIRDMMSNKLKTSGSRGEVDFDLPGNLVEHVVRNNLPVAEIITADYCIDSAGAEMACDTGAPYSAGMLTTRAFMAGNASRFNLARAAALMRVFACRIYPMEDELQPRAEKQDLIEMFRAETIEEQTVEEAKDAFGNGDGCFTCHGQFGLHAQLFVKYDEEGDWIEGATGVQDPNGELGRSAGGLMTSHFETLQAKRSEETQIFGVDVANLSEAAEVITQSDAFMPCMVRNLVEHGFGLSVTEAESTRIDVLKRIGTTITDQTTDPTFGDLMVETFSDPQIIVSVVGNTTEEVTQ